MLKNFIHHLNNFHILKSNSWKYSKLLSPCFNNSYKTKVQSYTHFISSLINKNIYKNNKENKILNYRESIIFEIIKQYHETSISHADSKAIESIVINIIIFNIIIWSNYVFYL